MAPLNWNPSQPFALGLEWPGMRTLALPLSQEAEYGYTFQAGATETIDKATFEIVPPTPNIDANATALITVYQRDSNDVDGAGNETEYGTVFSTMCAVNGGTVTAPAALQNSASVTAALVTPSDYQYVLVTGGGVSMNFATAGLFTGKRILELKLHYSATAVTATGPSALAVMFLNVNGDLIHIDGVQTNDPSPAPRTVRVLSLGEVNYPDALVPLCWPWTIADVLLFDSTTGIEFITGSPLVEYGLEYVALEVVWCEENRVAVGGLLMGASTGLGEEPMSVGQHTVNLRTPTGTDNWSKVIDNYYTVTLTSARSPGFGSSITKGLAPMIPAVDGFDVFINHQGRVAPRLPSNVLANPGVDSRITPIRFTTTAPATSGEGAPYDRALGAFVFYSNDAAQDIAQWSGGGTVSYPWIRFYARIIGDPVDVPAIDIKHTSGTMNFFATPLLALPEIFDGWREVTLQWPAGQEPAIDNTGASENFWFTTTQGNIQNRWEILALDSAGLMTGGNGAPTYGGGNAQSLWYDMPSGNVVRPLADLVVTIHTAVPAVTGFGAGLDFDNIAVPDWCADDEPGMPTEFWQASLTWDATTLSAAQFAYWEIQRKDTIDTTYETVAKLTTRTQLAWKDREVRAGVTSTFRMRQVRADGIVSAWTADDNTIIPNSPASGPVGTLMFTTNADPTIAPIVYREVFESEPAETFGFVEAEWVQVQHFFGRFGQQAFKPTERGGVRFDRTMLVNAFATPTRTGDEAFRLLRDLAWADIPYVCVKDDLGNRWYATLIVPDVNVRRAKEIFLASVQVIESTKTPYPANV